MTKPKKWTEKAAAAALQERINAEQGLPALVKSSETVDKSKPRDVWTYETYVISLGTVRFSVWSSYSRGQIHPGALRVRMTRCLLGK